MYKQNNNSIPPKARDDEPSNHINWFDFMRDREPPKQLPFDSTTMQVAIDYLDWQENFRPARRTWRAIGAGEKQTSAQSKSGKTRTQKRAQDGEPKGLRKNHQKYLVSKNNQFIDSDQESDDSSVPVKSSFLNSASNDHSKNHLPEEIAVGDTKVTQPRPKKRKSQESLDNLPDRKKRKKSKSDWVCLEDSSDLGFLQIFIGTDGETVRIHLGLGIKIDYETRIKAVNTLDDTKLLRKLIYFVWKPEKIINRFVQETDNLNDWEGKEPRKKVEKDRVKLVKGKRHRSY
ncbi:hypothetical protein QAD02_002736 [Eretmocerus hayati]|uniref:Uncharacterized protein n=1 Tax=Eretmocerus hayati TaxID=131215 RepID=A0ACC2NK51_9HYME|nr:hypothetical protein QAD02_002736 [Eretmocerus hayati]